MATAPAQDQRRLLDVQTLDTRARQLAHQRSTLPEVARVAELERQLADLDATLVSSRTAQADLRRELTKAESDVEQVRNRADRDQARLDSGQVSARDAQALTSELESLARRRIELEDIELGVMERLEAHQDTLSKVESAHADLTSDFDQAVVARDVRLAKIDAEAQGVAAERAKAVEGIDQALLALYQKVRDQNGGQGIVVMRGSRVEGLNMDISRAELAAVTAAAPEQIVRLEDYGHIVVRLDD